MKLMRGVRIGCSGGVEIGGREETKGMRKCSGRRARVRTHWRTGVARARAALGKVLGLGMN